MVAKKFSFGKQMEEDTGTKYQNYVTKFEKVVGDKGEYVHVQVKAAKLLFSSERSVSGYLFSGR